MTKVELTLPRRRRKFIKVEAVAELKAGREEGGGDRNSREGRYIRREKMAGPVKELMIIATLVFATLPKTVMVKRKGRQ